MRPSVRKDASGDRPTIRVEVVLAAAEGAAAQTLKLPLGATVGEAVAASRFAAERAAAVGVFGEVAPVDRPLKDGDRVDLLRPLLLAPQEARRRRAAAEGVGG